MGIYQGTITGKLISRQTAVGSRSEGPVYFLIPSDEYQKWEEIPIRKRIMRWMKDPVLHDLVGETISITGEIIETRDTITMEFTELTYNGKTIPASMKSGKFVVYKQDSEKY